MSTNFNTLSQFLNECNIPKTQETFGFLELIKKQWHENINSQIYAHFLGCGIPEIKEAFLSALVDLINEKTDVKLDIFDPIIQTEVTTRSRKRIDIVVEDFAGQSAIIIENKINHEVNNDLLDYWNHYQKFPESKRIGILLTKSCVLVPKEAECHFINITHSEWVTNAQSRLELSNLPINYQIYLSDFFNTIDNLTKSYIMNESAKFYFQHASKVLQASETKNHAVNFLNNQLELISSKLGLDMHGNSMDFRNYWDEGNKLHTFLTVVTKDLMQGTPRFMIILELFQNDIEKMEELSELFKDEPQFKDKNRGTVTKNYAHFLCKTYDISLSQFENLADTIINNIRKDFANITLKAIKHNYPNADISIWETQFLGSV